MHRGWTGLLPAWLLMASAGILALSALSLPRRPYTGVILKSDRVAGVVAGSPGDRAGIAAGDQLKPAGASEGGPASQLGLLAGAAPGTPLLLERRSSGGEWRRVWLVPEAQPAAERRMMAAQLAVCSGFVLLAGMVWSERRDLLTRTFLLCLAFAWLVMPTPLWPSTPATAVWDAVYSGITLFLPALFIHFFALFPEAGLGSPKVAAVVRAAYAIAILLLAAVLVEPWGQGSTPAGRALVVLQGAAAVWFAAGLVFALALFARSYFRARTPDARRRLRVALAGTLLGAGPLAILILVRNLSPETTVPGERWAVVLTLLVPASFAWAVVVHRIFDFRIALRAAALALVLLGIAVSAWFSGEWIARHWGARLGAQVEGLSLAGIALLSAVLGPVNTWARSLNARFDRDAGAASLGAWVAREEPAGSESETGVLSAACQALLEVLLLDGCLALAAAGDATAEVVRIGHLSPLALHPGLLARLDGEGGVIAVEDPRLAADDRSTLERAGVRWLLPVGRAPVRVLLLMGRRLSGAWLGRIEAHELSRFAEHVDVALENIELRRAARTRGALDRELQVAHAMQVNLLPRHAPVYPTLDCAATAVSSETVGGDYYDFVETSARDFTLAVGDAAGKGVPAALVLARVQAHFRDEARRAGSPGALLRALNRELVGLDQPEKFMGLLCSRVDVRTGRVWFANAGLTPPLVRRREGRFEELTAGGVLLGVSGDATYPDVGVDLQGGDVVVLYTDGLTEARRGDELFGVERVRKSLDACGTRRAADILEGLLAAVRDFADRPLDDLTVVVLRQLTDPVRGRNPLPQIGLKLGTT